MFKIGKVLSPRIVLTKLVQSDCLHIQTKLFRQRILIDS